MLDGKAWPLDYEAPRDTKRPCKWQPITPELHEKIKRLYMTRQRRSGQIREFADKHGLPRWKISKYATEHGFIEKQKKEPNWTDAETRILERHCHHSPHVVQRHLKRAGFSRSVTGIVLKRKRMRLLQNLDGQSARSLARCLGTEEHFVTRAITCGQLRAERRELNRTEKQGGNPFLIKDSDVYDFIVNNLHLIDLRQVDKYWFVDLLTSLNK